MATKFDHNTSKTEELEALRRFAVRFTERTYLYCLFTQEFMDWVEAQVMSDNLPNLFAQYDVSMQSDHAAQKLVKDLTEENNRLIAANHELHEELGQEETDNEILERRVSDLQMQLDTATSEIDRLKASNRRTMDEANESLHRNEELHNEVLEAYSLAAKHDHERAEAEARAEAAELEILKLKARMFDMLTAEAK